MILPPDEDASLLVCHVDLHEAILMRDLRKYQPAISQQPPQNVVLFNSGHGTQTNYRPWQGWDTGERGGWRWLRFGWGRAESG